MSTDHELAALTKQAFDAMSTAIQAAQDVSAILAADVIELAELLPSEQRDLADAALARARVILARANCDAGEEHSVRAVVAAAALPLGATQMTTITTLYNCLLEAAEAVISEGVKNGQLRDPHGFQAIAASFDDGLAKPRLVIDFLGDANATVALEFVGTRNGEPMAVLVFGTALKVPRAREMH